MTFAYKFMVFQCECGQRVMEVKIASCSDYSLIFEWICENCLKTTRAKMSFENLLADVPQAPEPLAITQKDKEFLHELHITLEDK